MAEKLRESLETHIVRDQRLNAFVHFSGLLSVAFMSEEISGRARLVATRATHRGT